MKERSQKTVKRLLVPTDFSRLAVAATARAVSLAERLGAEVVLLHVVETFPIDYLIGLNESKKTNAGLEQKARDRIEAAAKRIKSVPARSMVRWGKPFQEIVNAAKELQADMIVLSTRGYTGLKHVYLGSTCERVVRYAECPVLVVR